MRGGGAICQKWHLLLGNLEAVSDGCISIDAVAMKEQDGEWAGVSANHGFAVRKRMTRCEAFVY